MLLRLLGTYFWSNLYIRATLVSPLALLCTASPASMQNLTTALRRTFFGVWPSGVLTWAQTTSTGLWGSRYLYLGALALHPPSLRLKVPSTPLSLSAVFLFLFFCLFVLNLNHTHWAASCIDCFYPFVTGGCCTCASIFWKSWGAPSQPETDPALSCLKGQLHPLELPTQFLRVEGHPQLTLLLPSKDDRHILNSWLK